MDKIDNMDKIDSMNKIDDMDKIDNMDKIEQMNQEQIRSIEARDRKIYVQEIRKQS